MPTYRFYHLPVEKRMAIRRAALKEFARVPLEQVSINRIVKDADISRGSFYTYFTDKRDVMEYLLQEIQEKIEQSCLMSLKLHEGDCFLMLEDAFDYVVGYLKQEDHLRLYQNMVLSSSAFEHLLSEDARRERPARSNRILEWLSRQSGTAKRQLRQPIRERFEILLEVATPLLMRCACECCYGNGDVESTKQRFHEKLELLKCVVYL